MLVLAPTGRDAALSVQELRRADLPSIACPTAEDLIANVRRGAGPVVIVAEAINPDRAAALEAVLADEPAWSDLPVILVAGPASIPRHLRALVARRNTTLLHRPLKVATFVTTSQAALQNRLRQYEVRNLLRQLEDRAQQLQQLALELTETEERERQRLAEILHDDLQQILVGAKLQTAGLPKQADRGRLKQAVTGLSSLLEQAIEQARGLSHELRSPILQQHGLPAAIQSLAKRMHELYAMQVAVDVDPAADPLDDRVRTFLYRSAQELLLNVIKHAGVVEANVNLAAKHGRVVLRVHDRGRGIDPAVVKGDAAGSGLLTIRERADLLGGRFEVHGSTGEGAAFTLDLPLEQEASPEVASEGGEAVAQPSIGGEVAPRLRIMLTDDHRVMRSGLRSMLELEQDLEVVGEADDGVEAVNLAERVRPDLILMDLSMPRMDGIEATQRIKARHPAIRVIGLSMFNDDQSAMKMREAGAENYLPKAGPAEELLDAVRSSNGR